MFKLKSLFGLGMTMGHQLLYSTPMLDFFYFGVFSDEDLAFPIYKLKEILFSLLIIRGFLISLLKKKRLVFLLVFSNLSQYLIVSELFDSAFKVLKTELNILKRRSIFSCYFMLTPLVGFLSGTLQRVVSFKKDVHLPLNFAYDRLLILSFGDSVLPIVAKEALVKNSIVIALVDSNQVNT